MESNEAIKHSVMSGLGVSIVSAHTLTYGGQSDLVRLPVKELPIDSHWFFVWSTTKRRTVIAESFLEYVQAEGRELLHKELRRNKF